ncbi:hypothetical protein M0R45_009555 [Rubus argutus]|uniref:Uncharacterized protein n=1 Tax=Rubus argutus TaxID=59490 RepID=A0AAW1Y591_RUBAR
MLVPAINSDSINHRSSSITEADPPPSSPIKSIPAINKTHGLGYPAHLLLILAGDPSLSSTHQPPHRRHRTEPSPLLSVFTNLVSAALLLRVPSHVAVLKLPPPSILPRRIDLPIAALSRRRLSCPLHEPSCRR